VWILYLFIFYYFYTKWFYGFVWQERRIENLQKNCVKIFKKCFFEFGKKLDETKWKIGEAKFIKINILIQIDTEFEKKFDDKQNT
jgi:hypothetical protein